MTDKQKRTIEYLEKNIIVWDSYGRIENHEYKEFKIDETSSEYFISVSSTVGMKGDEGTQAECFCRSYRHIMIGKNGGVVAYGKKHEGGKDRKLVGITDVRIYGRRS